MKDLLYFIVMGSILWIVYAKTSNKSIIPWKETDTTRDAKRGLSKSIEERKNKKKKENHYVEQEPQLFMDLLSEVKDIKGHMVHLKGNKFLMFAEVRPCNYFLRSQDEQETIDAIFESWLASINYNIRVYLQTRYIDLSEPIEEMRKNMMEQDDLPPNAIEYGKAMLEDLKRWQAAAPRYEVKRYIIFPYTVKMNSINSEDTEEELAEKIEEKAFAELYRRLNAAKTILKKSYMEVDLLTTEGITEVLYHHFNRRKALKRKFKDIKEREMLSNYVTADQTQDRIELVKEMIKENEKLI